MCDLERKPINAVIFAAGVGSRISEVCLTENVSHKALLLIGSRTSLDHGLVTFNTAHIEGVHTTIVVHTREEDLRLRYQDKVGFLYQPVLDGTGGAIKQVIDNGLLQNEAGSRTVLANADDLRAVTPDMINDLAQGASPVTILLSRQEIVPDRNKYILNGSETHVLDISRSPAIGWKLGHFTGICAFDNRFLYDHVPKLKPKDVFKGEIGVPDLFLMALEEHVTIDAVMVDRWVCINKPEGLALARDLFNLPTAK